MKNTTSRFNGLVGATSCPWLFEVSKTIACLFYFLLATPLFAQVPNQFSFQGVARNAEGKMVASKSISLKITIKSEKPEGPVVYQETHEVMTNAAGIFNISIGGGSVLNGTLAAIDWKMTSYFLQLEMDPDGGSNLVDLGTTQLLSVPYAQYAGEASRWQNGYPVVQKFELGADVDVNDPNAPNDPDFQKYLLPAVGEGQRLIWYPVKGAFRAGYAALNRWEDNAIGSYSVAFGNDNMAIGAQSAAFGLSCNASGENSMAIGSATTANGIASTSMGSATIATGEASTALGIGTWARVEGSLAAGVHNDISDNPTDAILPTDRIFQIGNGHMLNNEIYRSNALTILRNGFTGIGKDAVEPAFLLDVSGRARIRNNGQTAGIYFNNAANEPSGFVGMVNDTQIGFFVGGGWKFFVGANGNAALAGALSQNSDRRLKRDIASLPPSLDKINSLKGYHYFWKNVEKDQNLQTGLVAQEVETIFPELVTTDGEGYKSVNYIGLIPHMIESIKELKAEIEMLKKARE
jgi:hypothetical protein